MTFPQPAGTTDSHRRGKKKYKYPIPRNITKSCSDFLSLTYYIKHLAYGGLSPSGILLYSIAGIASPSCFCKLQLVVLSDVARSSHASASSWTEPPEGSKRSCSLATLRPDAETC